MIFRVRYYNFNNTSTNVKNFKSGTFLFVNVKMMRNDFKHYKLKRKHGKRNVITNKYLQSDKISSVFLFYCSLVFCKILLRSLKDFLSGFLPYKSDIVDRNIVNVLQCFSFWLSRHKIFKKAKP